MAHEESNPVPADELVRGRVALSLRRYEPVGVVTAITPYNAAIIMALQKLIPALMAGNSVILRPSPLTPISSLLLGAAADAAGLPAGVLSVVVEGGSAGAELLTTDPAVDMVSFTGSTVVGKQILAQAATTVKRVALELGGKSAQIYLPDAVERAVAGAVAVVAMTSGQACVAATRMLVPQDRKDEVIEAVSRAYGAIVVGSPTDPTTMMGPVISAGQRERCARFVALAEEHGGKVAVGGHRPSASAARLLLRTHGPRCAGQRQSGGAGGDLRPRSGSYRLSRPGRGGGDCQRQRVRTVGAGLRSRCRRGDGCGAAAPNGRGEREYDRILRLRAEWRLQAERPRPRTWSGRDPRVPRSEAHRNRRTSEMTTKRNKRGHT